MKRSKKIIPLHVSTSQYRNAFPRKAQLCPGLLKKKKSYYKIDDGQTGYNIDYKKVSIIK